MVTDDARPARAAASLARVVELALADAGLSLAQYRLLAYLSRGSSAASPAARDLSTSRPSVTALVDGVVARGLVERFPDRDDRRRITLALTPLGFETLDRADAAAAARLAAVASYLSATDATRALDALPLWTDAIRAEAAQPAVPAP